MSSIIKNTAISYKPDNSYYIDPDKVTEVTSSEKRARSLKDTLTASLNDLEAKIKVANHEYDNIINKCDSKIEETNQLIEKLKKEAYDDAYAKGYNDGKKKLNDEYSGLTNKLQLEYESKINEFNLEKVDFINRMRDEITDIITTSVGNILNENIKEDKDKKNIVDTLILRGLCSITDEKEVKVFLSEDDYKTFDRESIISSLGTISYDLSFSFKKELKPFECILETNLGYVDVSLDNLLNSICTFVKGKIN